MKWTKVSYETRGSGGYTMRNRHKGKDGIGLSFRDESEIYVEFVIEENLLKGPFVLIGWVLDVLKTRKEVQTPCGTQIHR